VVDPVAGGRAAAKAGVGGSPGASGGLELEKPPMLGGYCPVTIQEAGLWVRGRYDYRVERDGVLLLTAGPKEKKALEEDLARYMPALGGNCPVSFVDHDGARLAGSPFQSVLFRGRLFLFVDAERRAAFKSDPVRYANIDVAADGMCVVTQQDHGRTEPGLAEHAAWFRGRHYQFAGAEQKATFLASPEKYAKP
jgi:YHS domain-containing protein